MIAWGPFRPDAGGPGTGFAQIADSVLPQTAVITSPYGQRSPTIGYRPFPSLITVPGAGALAGGAPRGSLSLVTSGGASQVYVGTATTIEQLQGDYTFSTIEGGRTVTAGDDVSFLRFGSFLLNTDTTDGFKAYNFDTPAGNNVVATAPTARRLFSCSNVVFALGCNGINTRMQSSGMGDHTAWNTLGADGVTFADGGALVEGVDLKNGAAVVFQAEAMRVIQFGNAASPALYSTSKAANGRGSVGYRSVVSFDGAVYFLAPDGFYKFDLEHGNTPIGAEKVNRWFLAHATTDLSTVQGSVDPQNKIVCWRYRSITNVSSTVFNDMICYDWQLDEWFTVTVATSALTRITTPGYTMDSMAAFGDMDSIQTLMDDPFWGGGAPLYGAIDGNNKFATFSGPAMAATLQSYVTHNPVSGIITRATPLSDDPTSTLQLGVKRSLSDAMTWKPKTGKGRAGRVAVRGGGVQIAFQENFPAGDMWTFANGVDDLASSQNGPV